MYFDKNNISYYKKITINCYFEIIGLYKITDNSFNNNKCYKFISDEKKELIRIEFLVDGMIKNDDYLKTAIIKYEYSLNTQKRTYLDNKGLPKANSKGVFSNTVKYRNNLPYTIFNYDQNDDLIEDIYFTTQYIISYNSELRNIKILRTKSDGKIIKDRFEIKEIICKYDKSDNLTEFIFLNSNNELIGNKDEVAIYKFEFDDKKNIIKKSTYNVNNKLIASKDNFAIFRYKFDNNGNEIENCKLGIDKQLVKDKYGIYIYRFKYDINSNLIEKSFYDQNEQLIEDEYDISIYSYVFDSSNNEIMRSFYGSYMQLVEDDNGVAIYRYSYNLKGMITEESFYGIDEKLKENDENISIYKYLYDEDDNLTEESYYNKYNQLTEDRDGIAIYKYIYDENFKRIEKTRFGKFKNKLKEKNTVELKENIEEIQKESNTSLTKYPNKNNSSFNIADHNNFLCSIILYIQHLPNLPVFDNRNNSDYFQLEKITNPYLNRYICEISKEELLTAEQEVQLSQTMKKGGLKGVKAKDKIVHANLRFVVSVAKQYQNQGLSFNDLLNEGNIGLINAASRFDETKGFKFISYAVWWIRQAILQAIAEQSRIVRLPLNKVGALNKILKVKTELKRKYNIEPGLGEIARVLDISEHDVDEIIKLESKTLYFSSKYLSKNRKVINREFTLDEFIADIDQPPPDEILFKDSLIGEISRSISTLKDIEKDVIKLYFGIDKGKSHTLEEIGSIYNRTRERIRQIKEKALSRLRHASRSRNLRIFLG